MNNGGRGERVCVYARYALKFFPTFCCRRIPCWETFKFVASPAVLLRHHISDIFFSVALISSFSFFLIVKLQSIAQIHPGTLEGLVQGSSRVLFSFFHLALYTKARGMQNFTTSRLPWKKNVFFSGKVWQKCKKQQMFAICNAYFSRIEHFSLFTRRRKTKFDSPSLHLSKRDLQAPQAATTKSKGPVHAPVHPSAHESNAHSARPPALAGLMLNALETLSYC